MGRDCSSCKQPLTTETACRTAIAKGGYCRVCHSAYKRRQSEARGLERRRQLHAARERIPCLPIPRVPRKPGTPMAYNSLHARLRRVRGAASALICIDCGRQADEWSYRGGCPDELSEARGQGGLAMPYTLDLSMYDPRCKSCHVKRDATESSPCMVATCTRGIARRFDYCPKHWIGPRKPRRGGVPVGSALGRTLGPRDDNGRVRDAHASGVRPDSTMTHKTCNRCGKTKNVRGFSTRGRDMANRRDPYKGICLECDRIKSAERYRRQITAKGAVRAHPAG
jgi:hypothetical protein